MENKKTGRDKLLGIIHSLRTQWQWLMIALILLFFTSKRRLISIQIDKARNLFFGNENMGYYSCTYYLILK